MATSVNSSVVSFWDSALGHSVRDFLVGIGSSLVILVLDQLSQVQLTGPWAQYAFLVPILITAIKTYFHVRDPKLPNLPTSLT
jgi:hypothetical protein